jgi:hypothetical protein
MKKILLSSLAGVALLALATPALAEEKTITGEGKCAKCALHETEKCQNVIQAKEGDKTVTYYLADNDVSKAFHKDNLCKGSKEVTATGEVSEKDGKKILTVSKIEAAK